MDDGELLHQYASGRSEAAFAELVRRNIDLVYSAALRQMGGDHHRAEEIVQLVFSSLARKAGALASHPVLAAWLYRGTRLEAANYWRLEKRRQRHERELAVMKAAAESPGDIDWDRVRPVLDEAMNDLSEPDRAAVLLRFFSNKPFAEVGRRLGLSENTARMRVERALDKLQGLLARRGITSTTAALAAALAQQAVTAAPAGLAASTAGAALAGAAQAGGAAALTSLMATIKLQLTVVGAVIATGAGVSIAQQRANARMEGDIAGLRRQVAGIADLEAQNRKLASDVAEASQLADDTGNLAVLQSQAAALRARLAAAQAGARGPAVKMEAYQQGGPGPMAGAAPAFAFAPDPGNGMPVFDISKLDQVPVPTFQVRPQYPPEMGGAGSSGQVVVDFIVGPDGSVRYAFAANSTDPAFESAAVDAVKQWRFKPGRHSGQAVNTHMQVPIVFVLPSGGTGWF